MHGGKASSFIDVTRRNAAPKGVAFISSTEQEQSLQAMVDKQAFQAICRMATAAILAAESRPKLAKQNDHTLNRTHTRVMDEIKRESGHKIETVFSSTGRPNWVGTARSATKGLRGNLA